MRFYKRKDLKSKFELKSEGVCPICEKPVEFVSKNEWLRDHFLCNKCGSIPRERALIHTIKTYYPEFNQLMIHESSPSSRGASLKLQTECEGYSSSYFYPDVKCGDIHPEYKVQCQNLENLTFEDKTFDLFVTQDVMEHVFDPGKAFSEIARVLKPGGAHIFTVPIINKSDKTECWASRNDRDEIVYHREPEYHGNPIDDDGALVTMHWGYDIADFIVKKSGTPTTIVMIDNLQLGIRAEYIEVLVSHKY